jgi:G:T-mismatch repair DNA endonuclease (very short patch repair protein)
MEIARLGWEYIIVWECELRDFDSLASKLEGFLEAQ